MIPSRAFRLHAPTLAVPMLLPILAAQAGDLDAPAAPSDADSAMYTLEDIYQRLDKGTEATKRTGAFTEPSTGPSTGTMHDLNAIMELINTRAPVAKTGQTACYAENGDSISCSDTGQDGELQKGVTLPTPRFTINVNASHDNGAGGGTPNNGICDGAELCNGTVTDNLTGLIWLRNADCAQDQRDWEAALSDVKSLNSTGDMNNNDCGDISNSDSRGDSHQTDWRLPNIKELQSLIDFTYYGPALSNTAGTAQWTTGSPFESVRSDYYWSSSTYALVGFTSQAWILFLTDGDLHQDYKDDNNFVWPVRGGQ